MIKKTNLFLSVIMFFSIGILDSFSQVRFALGAVGGYNISYMTYNSSKPVPDSKFSYESYNPFIGLNFTVTQKDILYAITGINFYKVYYGFSDNNNTKILFTDKSRDVPLNFGLRIAKTKKDKTFFYIQGGLTFRFHSLTGVFAKYGVSNNSAFLGSNFDSEGIAYIDTYNFVSNTSGTKLYATFAPNIGFNARKNINARIKFDYGFSVNYQEINNQVKINYFAGPEEYLFAPNSRTTLSLHAGLYFFLIRP